jgi:DNA polymerase
MLILKKEYLAAELLKLAWREANPKIVQYWRLLEMLAVSAVMRPGVVTSTPDGMPPVSYVKKGSFLFCRLPSGRRLTYPYPEVSIQETPWGQPKKTLTYKFEHPTTRQWIRGGTYGGSLTENVVQAVSADVLREALVKATDYGYPIVMHVHDELVAEVDEDFGSVSELESIASEQPAWASGLPIAAEGWRGNRYRK